MMGTARSVGGYPFMDRLRRAMLKPVDPDAAPVAPAGPPPTVEEARAAVRSADDKERLIGLLAAPVAAGIALITTSTLIANDPPALLANGTLNKLHVSVGVYHELLIALMALAFVMIGSAWFRKRLFLGVSAALYGLALFNMHYWGFGIPYLMIGSWLLVRSYRAQRELKAAEAGLPGPGRGGAGGSPGYRPMSSKRYTPPTQARRPSRYRRPD